MKYHCYECGPHDDLKRTVYNYPASAMRNADYVDAAGRCLRDGVHKTLVC